jgi:hypothetical protein
LIEVERGAFAAFFAANPDTGDVIVGTGGLRKVRWSRAGSGKSGSVRVVYFSRNAAGELVLSPCISSPKPTAVL